MEFLIVYISCFLISIILGVLLLFLNKLADDELIVSRVGVILVFFGLIPFINVLTAAFALIIFLILFMVSISKLIEENE